MKKVILSPATPHGEIRVPPSKSAAHRAILCAALSHGRSVVDYIDLSADILATLRGADALGASVRPHPGGVIIDGTHAFQPGQAEIHCGESGSTLRFLVPIAAAGGLTCTFTGSGRLPERPIDPLLWLLREHGVACETDGTHSLPLTISGKLKGGSFHLPGDISSQYISGLLLALPLCEEDSEIILTSPLQSAGYVDLTLQMLSSFSVHVEPTQTGWKIKGKQSFRAHNLMVEGDWSAAAFFLTAGALGGEVAVRGLNRRSMQGDRACKAILSQCGSHLRWSGDTLTSKAFSLDAMEIDAGQIPDLVPILAVLGAYCSGDMRIYNAARLRLKESDRLESTAAGLRALGVPVTQTADSLTIHGGHKVRGGVVDGCNDHRIVMAFSIAAMRADDTVIISDAQSVKKSYPTFFEDYMKIGGVANVVDMG